MRSNLISITLIFCISFFAESDDNLEKKQVSLANSILGNDLANSSASMVNKFEITAGKSKKTADIVFKPLKSSGNFSITLSAPLNDTSDSTDLYQSKTDVFANSTSIKLNYRIYVPPEFSLPPSKRRKVVDLCISNPGVFSFESTKETAEGIKKETTNYCETNIDLLVTKFNKKNAKPEEISLVEEVKAQYTAPFSFYGTTASYGREEYKYFKKDLIETTDDTNNPWALSVYYSYVIPDTLWATVEFSYQEGYETQGAESRCPLISEDNETFVSCISSATGAPTEETNKNLSLSARFPLGSMALAPKLTYDFEDDEHTFTLPVYFIGNNDGDFTAGIRFDHESGGEGSKVSLFVGSKFEVF